MRESRFVLKTREKLKESNNIFLSTLPLFLGGVSTGVLGEIKTWLKAKNISKQANIKLMAIDWFLNFRCFLLQKYFWDFCVQIELGEVECQCRFVRTFRELFLVLFSDFRTKKVPEIFFGRNGLSSTKKLFERSNFFSTYSRRPVGGSSSSKVSADSSEGRGFGSSTSVIGMYIGPSGSKTERNRKKLLFKTAQIRTKELGHHGKVLWLESRKKILESSFY